MTKNLQTNLIFKIYTIYIYIIMDQLKQQRKVVFMTISKKVCDICGNDINNDNDDIIRLLIDFLNKDNRFDLIELSDDESD